jgi:ribosome-binding factor A
MSGPETGMQKRVLQTSPRRDAIFLIFSFVLSERFSRGAIVESRGAKYHRGRLGEALREELLAMLEGELGDPRIGLATVSSVALADDSRSARVFVTVDGDDDEAKRTLEGLTAAVGFIRREVAERLHLRRAPELFFQVDRSGQHVARIDQLLKRTRKKKTG